MHVESDIMIIAPAIAGVVLAVSSLIYFCFLKESSGSRETANKIDEFASILAGTSKNDAKDAKNKKKSKKNLGRQQSQQQQQQTANAEKKQKREQKNDGVKTSESEEITDETAVTSLTNNLTVHAKEEILAKAHMASDKIGQLTQAVRETSSTASNKAVAAGRHAKEDLLAKAHELSDKVTDIGQKTIDAACVVLPASVTAKLSASTGKVQQQAQKLMKATVGAEQTKTSEAKADEKPTKNADNADTTTNTNKPVKNKKQEQVGRSDQTVDRQRGSQSSKQQQQAKTTGSETLSPLNIAVDGDDGFTDSSSIASGKPSTAQLNQFDEEPDNAESQVLHPGMVLAGAVSSRHSSTSSADEQLQEQKRRVNALFQKKPDSHGESLELGAPTPAATNKPIHAVGAVGENRSQSRQSNLSASFAENNLHSSQISAADGVGARADNNSTKRPRNNNKGTDDRLSSKLMSSDAQRNGGNGGKNDVLEERREETIITTTTTTAPAVRSANGTSAGTAATGRRKAHNKTMNGIVSPAVNEDVQQIGELIMATNLTTEDYARLSRIVTEKGTSVYGDEWFESNKKGTVRQTQNQQPTLIPGFAAYLLHQKEQDLENEHKLASRHAQQVEQLQKQNQQLSRQLNDIRTKSQTESQHVRQQYEQTMQSRSVEIQRLKEQLQSLAPQLNDTQRLRAELNEKTSQFEQLRQLQLSSAQQYEREKQQLLRELHSSKQEAEQRSRDIEQAQQQLHEQQQQELHALQQQARAQEHHLQQQLTETERKLREREVEVKRVEERVQHNANDALEQLNAQIQEHVQANKLLERQLSDLHGELDTITARHQSTISTTEEKVRQLEQQIEQREREWHKSSSEDKLELERLRKQLAEVAAQVPSEDLRKNLEDKQNEVDRLTARVSELEQESKKHAGKAVEIRDKLHAERDVAQKRAEQAEARLAAVEQQQQQAIETSRQQQQQRITELETVNQKLEADLQHMRDNDERRSTQIKELKEDSRRIRQEMEQQQQQQAAAVALNSKDSVTSTESNEYEIVNHNNNNAADAALLRQQIEAVNVLRNDVSSAEKLVIQLETECRELVDAHNRTSSASENGDASALVITKRVTTVTTEHHDIPLSSNIQEEENLVEEIKKVDVAEPVHT